MVHFCLMERTEQLCQLFLNLNGFLRHLIILLHDRANALCNSQHARIGFHIVLQQGSRQLHLYHLCLQGMFRIAVLQGTGVTFRKLFAEQAAL